MGRYAGYPQGFLLAKAGILALGLPVIFYLTLCNALSQHYRTELDNYDNAALSIADGWSDLKTFNKSSVCTAYRLLAAGSAAAAYPPFNAWWMIRNWHTDFLQKQPPCM